MTNLKFDKEKTRLELIPPEFIEATGRGLTYGANKYTVTKWERFWNVLNLTALELSLPSGVVCAVHVTKNTFVLITLSMQRGNGKTQETGLPVIETAYSKLRDAMQGFQKFVNDAEQPLENASSSRTESPSVLLTKNYKEVAKFVEVSKGFTLTTTTQQDGIEEYFAVSATKVSDCLETTLKELKPQLTTLERTQHVTDLSGAGNWANDPGFDWSRLYGALQRHLNSWAIGRDIDDESGNKHLDHACCMLAFLVAHTERSLGKDDRVDVGMVSRPVESNSRPIEEWIYPQVYTYNPKDPIHTYVPGRRT